MQAKPGKGHGIVIVTSRVRDVLECLTWALRDDLGKGRGDDFAEREIDATILQGGRPAVDEILRIYYYDFVDRRSSAQR